MMCELSLFNKNCVVIVMILINNKKPTVSDILSLRSKKVANRGKGRVATALWKL